MKMTWTTGTQIVRRNPTITRVGNRAGAVPRAKAAALRKAYTAMRVKLTLGFTLGFFLVVLVLAGANTFGLIAAALVAAGAAFGAWTLYPKARSDRYIIPWEMGAKGEEETGRTLDLAETEGFRVHHGTQNGNGGDTDHWTVSPCGGVATIINTKQWRADGTVTVSATGGLALAYGKGIRSQDKDLTDFIGHADRFAKVVSQVGATTTNVIIVQGARVEGGHIVMHREVPEGRNWKGKKKTRTMRVDIVQGAYLMQALRSPVVGRRPNPQAADRLEHVLADAFPPFPIAN